MQPLRSQELIAASRSNLQTMSLRQNDTDEENGWYEVTVETYSDLGKSRYTLIVSRGHNAELGDVWRVDPNETVIAWKERPLPYGGDK